MRRWPWGMGAPKILGVRRGVSLALVMALLLSGAALISMPSDGLSSDVFEYRLINGDNEAEITGYSGLGGKVIIPDNIGGVAVTSIGDSAFIGQKTMTSVSIPQGIRSIGPKAFQRCESLTSIKIPNTTTTIGESAFRQCNYLATVDLGDGLTSLGSSVFQDCRSLTSIDFSPVLITIGDNSFSYCSSMASFDLPNSLTSVGQYAFSYCTSLTQFALPNGLINLKWSMFTGCYRLGSLTIGSENPVYASVDGMIFNKELTTLMKCPTGRIGYVDLPTGVLEIAPYAFQGCRSLRSVDLPDTARSIGDYAFDGCYILVSVDLGNGMEVIGDYAFYNCDSLTRLELPAGLTSIGHGSFRGCHDLATFDVDPDNQVFASHDGVLYDKENSALSVCPEGRAGHVDVPEGTLKIADYALYRCDYVTSMNYPMSLIEIGNFSFSGSGLTSATLPDGLKMIGDGAFLMCESLTEVRLPEDLIDMGEQVFSQCGSLLYVDLPEGITEIGQSCFAWCYSLVSVSLPDGLTEIGRQAFMLCSSLSVMVFPASLTTIDNYAFSSCSSLLDLYFEGDAPFCGEGWIPHNTNLMVHYRPGVSGFTTPTWQDLPSNASSIWIPSSPQNLMARAGDGYAVLTWQAPQTGEDEGVMRYTVYVDDEPLPVDIAETSYEVAGLSNGRTYSFRVTAVNEAGEGRPSSTVLLVPGPLPPSPSDLRFISDLDGVNLRWSAVPGADHYLVYRGESRSALSFVGSTGSINYPDGGLASGTFYFYAVSAVNNVGEGAMSEPLEAFTLTTVEGIVLSEGGAPLEGVTVRMEGAGNTLTNSTGAFVLLAAPGEREIVMEGEGLDSRTLMVEVSAEGTDMGLITMAEAYEMSILTIVAIAIIIISSAAIAVVVYLGHQGRRKGGEK